MGIKREQALELIRRLLKGFHLFWAVLFFLMGMAAVWLFRWSASTYSEIFVPTDIEKSIPYYEEVKKVIEPLRYSGFNAFMMPDVKISIDFTEKKWSLHNIHRFDKDGKVMLSEGRYGVCGELAAYVYEKIRPIFPAGDNIKFISLSESGYFLHPRASHIALVITKHSLLGGETYLLDPSFHKYGRISHFDEYAFFGEMNSLPFVQERDPDQSFQVGAITPIRIKKDFLVGLVVDEMNGKFDQDNFLLAITATRRFKYAGRYLLAFRRIAGQTEIFENKHLAYNILEQETYDKLRERMVQIYSQLP
ncbi:MAG: hypothetical protein WCL25_05385 [bacterium]